MLGKAKQKASTEGVVGEVVLQFLEGENEGVEIRVNPPRKLTIGRGEECDIFLAEKKISRTHCEVSVEKDAITISDLKSTNGTYVNAKKISQSQLGDGDKFRVGTSVIQISIVHQVEESAPETAASIDMASPDVASQESGDMFEPDDSPSGVLEVSEESFSVNVGGASIEPAPSLEDEAVKIPGVDDEAEPKPLSGNLSAMGLADLLQNLTMNQKSGLLRISAASEGEISIQDGNVVNASVGKVQGTKAMYRMLGWNEGSFELLPLPEDFDEKKVEKPFSASLESLLMEGFRQFDELQKIKKGLPPDNANLQLKKKLKSPLAKLHPRVLDILQVVINEEQFSSVLDESSLTDLETSKIIFYLIKKEYIIAT